SGSDIILLPETPFDFRRDIVEVLKARASAGYKYHIIAFSEGAYPTKESLERDFTVISRKDIDECPRDVFGNPLLAKLNLASKIAKELKKREDLKKHFEESDSNYEVRDVVLGHTMRAGSPGVYDRILGLRYGYHAMGYILEGNFGKMASLQGTEIKPVDIIEGAKKKLVNPQSDLVEIKEMLTAVKYKSKKQAR
ncbi:MAG TPA: 6-phosphofructokinase, partial [bacterium]|nr:6-phosphofructokinase [bacterium]